jgi:hypothetical protein
LLKAPPLLGSLPKQFILDARFLFDHQPFGPAPGFIQDPWPFGGRQQNG